MLEESENALKSITAKDIGLLKSFKQPPDLVKRVFDVVLILFKMEVVPAVAVEVEIKGNKRGVYFLAYFRVDPAKLTGLERDCNLSEQLLRSMVVRADHVPSETVEAAEGRAQLADEIKLRSEQTASSAGSYSHIASSSRPV